MEWLPSTPLDDLVSLQNGYGYYYKHESLYSVNELRHPEEALNRI